MREALTATGNTRRSASAELSGLTDAELARLLSERAGDVLAELGRRAVAKRLRADRACATCGRPMGAVTGVRRTCSSACRVKRQYWARKAKTDPAAAHRLRLEAKGWLPAGSRTSGAAP